MAGRKARRSSGRANARRIVTPVGPTLDLTNLVFRLKADDLVGADLDSVSAWGTTAAQPATANMPKLRTNVTALGGHRAVEFDGTNDFLTLSGSALETARNRSQLTTFIVFKLPATAVTGTRTLLALSSGTAAGSARHAVYASTTQAADIYVDDYNDAYGITVSNAVQLGGRRLDTDAFGSVASSSSLATGQVGVLTASHDYATSTASLYLNGTMLATSSNFQTSGATSDTSSLSGSVGANSAATAEWYVGQIAEILSYSADSTTLRANVHTYIQDTYGITVVDYAGVGSGAAIPNTVLPGPTPGTTWVPQAMEDFNTPAARGTIVPVTTGSDTGLLPSTNPYYQSFKVKTTNSPDTDNIGKYNSGLTTSISNSVMDIWAHTEGGQPYGGAVKLLNQSASDTNFLTYGRISVRMWATSTAAAGAGRYGMAALLINSAQWSSTVEGWSEWDFPEEKLDSDTMGGFYHPTHPVGVSDTSDPVNCPPGTTFDVPHTYTMEWYPEGTGARARWYCDGALVYDRIDRVPVAPMKLGHLIQVGTNGGLPPGAEEAHLYIDWIAIHRYQPAAAQLIESPAGSGAYTVSSGVVPQDPDPALYALVEDPAGSGLYLIP